MAVNGCGAGACKGSFDLVLRLLSSEEEEPRARQAGVPALCEQ